MFTKKEFTMLAKRVKRSNAAHARLQAKHFNNYQKTGSISSLVRAEYHGDVRAAQDTRLLSKDSKKKVYSDACTYVNNLKKSGKLF